MQRVLLTLADHETCMTMVMYKPMWVHVIDEVVHCKGSWRAARKNTTPDLLMLQTAHNVGFVRE